MCFLIRLIVLLRAYLVESSGLHEGSLVRHLTLFDGAWLAVWMLLMEVVLVIKLTSTLRPLNRASRSVWL